MKRIFLICMICLFGMTAKAQKNDVKAVKQVIGTFALAGDKNDATLLEKQLDDNYRIVMNQLFGSKEVEIMNKGTYLEKIRSKQFGGDKRKLDFKEVIINGNTAVVKVIMKGEKSTFHSLICLVKDVNNRWKLISDTPVII